MQPLSVLFVTAWGAAGRAKRNRTPVVVNRRLDRPDGMIWLLGLFCALLRHHVCDADLEKHAKVTVALRAERIKHVP